MWKFTNLALLLAFCMHQSFAFPSEYSEQFYMGQTPNFNRRHEHQKQMKVFDSMQFGGPFGVSKRASPVEKRGSLDSLSLGNSFGRSVRRDGQLTDILRRAVIDLNNLMGYNKMVLKEVREQQAGPIKNSWA
ncbi:PREDICTED: uncharacterized protein LOC108568460 isoform X4 [Nicrophorus vespilloides]|uniref:Uncharacterized protein LOC108568460 isoform X4 n=1 Tax=Nicrophorus vespilloides TaxID=110193 RepID=A0ABM1NE07_NICVS|nr:PREDICTED: uncharacterized protein LOC108568460 isoform X4 [Nicrophorus vespilloides]